MAVNCTKDMRFFVVCLSALLFVDVSIQIGLGAFTTIQIYTCILYTLHRECNLEVAQLCKAPDKMTCSHRIE